MSVTLAELEQTALLAYLDPQDAPSLLQACNNVFKQIDQLKNIDTEGVEPLTHPIQGIQYLREDHPVMPSIHTLAAVAPVFSDDMYSVPTVIKG